MIELPEVVTLARQITEELEDARIASCERGASPHKFVWYNREPAEYEEIAVGKTVGEATADGNRIACPLEPGYVLFVGDMGGKILLHADETTLPKKRHLMLGFEDGVVWTTYRAGAEGVSYTRAAIVARKET